MLDKIIKGKTERPRRVMLYGTHGIGKTMWASQAPDPIFLVCEEGADDIGPDRTPLLTDFGQVNSWCSQLITEKHEYKTLVIDTADWLERLIWQAVCMNEDKPSIEKIGFGKGYVYACDGWRHVLKQFDHLRTERGMNIVLLAHCKIARFTPPDNDTYDRYEPDLHKLASPLVQEWCDEVLFATYHVDTIQTEEGFDSKRTRAVGTTRRTVYTSETPVCLAKRRIKMPEQIDLQWQSYAKCIQQSLQRRKTSG